MINILFVCSGNSCRSQMAEGFGKTLSGGRFGIKSAGTSPVGVHPMTIKTMNEVGIDISSQYSKGFNQVPVKSFDYFVTMGCGETCPIIAAKERIDWQIEDPIGQPIEGLRRIRDTIKPKIEDFLTNL